MIGQTILTLANNGHSLADLETYSWSALCALLENLAEQRDPQGKRGRPSHTQDKPNASGEVTVPMEKAEYYRRMGVTDPKLIEKLSS